MVVVLFRVDCMLRPFPPSQSVMPPTMSFGDGRIVELIRLMSRSLMHSRSCPGQVEFDLRFPEAFHHPEEGQEVDIALPFVDAYHKVRLGRDGTCLDCVVTIDVCRVSELASERFVTDLGLGAGDGCSNELQLDTCFVH